MGLGMLGLQSLMGPVQGSDLASASRSPLAAKSSPFQPRARRVIHFFLNGGPSHVDSFDPKPALERWAGKSVPTHLPTERKTGAAMPSPWKFRPRGQSGLEISELFPRIAEHADELCVIRSMQAKLPNHEPSLMLMNCGDAVQSRPSVGSWITYGLGSENENLPGFIAMCPNGLPVKEQENWQAGFLPGTHSGTWIDTQHTRIEKLIENIRNDSLTLASQRRQLNYLKRLNVAHQASRSVDPRLESRIQSFELAFRMQLEAAEAFDVEREPESVRAMYGDGVHGRQTLIARRLLERGVRYIQLWHGAGQPWDSHDKIEENHGRLAREIDQPVAALLTDLRQRGMLEDTLVVWGGEFGRTPSVELNTSGKSQLGRDHNPYGFSLWLAGGGVRGGISYGSTDEFGFKAVENIATIHDLHATILHLLGFDHEAFTFRHAGRDFRLTDVYGEVIRPVLA